MRSVLRNYHVQSLKKALLSGVNARPADSNEFAAPDAELFMANI